VNKPSPQSEAMPRGDFVASRSASGVELSLRYQNK